MNIILLIFKSLLDPMKINNLKQIVFKCILISHPCLRFVFQTLHFNDMKTSSVSILNWQNITTLSYSNTTEINSPFTHCCCFSQALSTLKPKESNCNHYNFLTTKSIMLSVCSWNCKVMGKYVMQYWSPSLTRFWF